MNLFDIQTFFTNGLKPDCLPYQLQLATSVILDNKRIPAKLALAIYTNNTSGARRNALHATYPACLRILGKECFNNIAHHFINRVPSEQSDLNMEGAGFNEFLSNWVAIQSAFAELQYLGDLAQLEWYCHSAYYADDDIKFDSDSLAMANNRNPDAIRFQLAHSVSLLESDYPVIELRQINLSNNTVTEIISSDLPEYLVVSRQDFQATVTRINKHTFDLLCDVRAGKCLDDIICGNEVKANELIESLPEIIQHGWICNMSGGN